MVSSRSAFSRGLGEDSTRELLLPHHHRRRYPYQSHRLGMETAKDITKVALRLKYLIEATIPCELKESHVTRPHSPIITNQVLQLAKQAGGEENRACVVYCLLVCLRWFRRQAVLEMYDAELNLLRAEACQVIAKKIIESEQDQGFLFQDILLQRFSILKNGKESAPCNAIEQAIDVHATRVIGSSGYQKCIQYLWKGWLVQDENDPTKFVPYKEAANKSFWVHFDHDRMRAPKYQNLFQIFVSFLYLVLYTIAINTVDPTGDIGIEEICLYTFTLGFIADEALKFWKIGRYYIGFWNVFNITLYTLLVISFATRVIALSHPLGSGPRRSFNTLSYNFLAFVAPMFWCRMLLYLDAIRFFGAMLVVLKVMMKESLIFFALLAVIIIGFLQAFIGLDNTEEKVNVTGFILKAMTNAVLQSPELDGFADFSHPFGTILYYLFTFVVMVILLNILIALYNQAYTDITENAIDEYLALFAHKTMQFVRAPDENVFLPPFNLIEILCLILPFEWWMEKRRYSKLNDYVMGVIYTPFMFLIAWHESRTARKISANRARGQEDDDETEEWEELDGEINLESEGWKEKVKKGVPNVEEEKAIVEIGKLKEEIGRLRHVFKTGMEEIVEG